MRRNQVALSILLLGTAVMAAAQSDRGSITGTVADASGAALQGAKVTVTPGGSVALTNATGQFTLTGVPAGSYKLLFTYAGFADDTDNVTVQGGKDARVNETMKIASNQQNVTVYVGRQGGEVEAINRTVQADNIIQVLPADVITSLPNANVADAIGRLPSVSLERDEGEGKYVQVRGTEPRLTNTTVDGVNLASAETVRQVKLDIIPSDLVESVQINKTLQANMEGDGIGGSVDLRTKSAAARPTIDLNSTGGYTPIIGGRPVYQFDGTLGRRFYQNKLGILFGGSYDWNGRGINDVEPAPFFGLSGSGGGGYDERDYRYYRSRMGFAGTIDYSFSDTSSVYLKGLYALFHNFGDRWRYGVVTTYDANYNPTPGGGALDFGAESRRPVQDLGSLQLGGHHLVSNYLINWDLESSIGRTRDENYDDAEFSNPNAYSFAADASNPLIPKLTTVDHANIYDPTQYTLVSTRVNNYYNPEVDLGFGGSVLKSYSLGGHANTTEFGGRFRNVHKFANQDTLYYVPAAAANDPSLNLSNLLSDFTDPNYYGNNYTFGPVASYEKILQLQMVQDPNHTNQVGSNFDYIEKVSAGYVMQTVNFSKVRIVGGLRFENTSTHDAGAATSNAPVVAKNGSYLDVLPSASVRFAITPDSGLRLVYGRGLSRPNFSDLVSFASISPGGVRTTSSVGNPNLKAEHADNFDVLYEQSLEPVGLLQAGMYFKHLADPIVPVNTTLPLPGGGTTLQTQPQNVGSGYVFGLEIAFQQHFTYLHGFLHDLGVSANYGYSYSKAKGLSALGRSDTPALLRQAPNTWNISPTYDHKKLSIRAGFTYNAANIFAYQYTDSAAAGAFDPTTGNGGGLHGANGDQYLYAHLQIDAQGSYRLPKGFTAVFYGLNLNNEVFGFYNGSPNIPVQREFYKPTFGGGVRWSPEFHHHS